MARNKAFITNKIDLGTFVGFWDVFVRWVFIVFGVERWALFEFNGKASYGYEMKKFLWGW